MSEVVNLRQARKRRDKAAQERAAQENRIRFGRTKAARAADAAERGRQDRAVDGARLDDDETTRRD